MNAEQVKSLLRWLGASAAGGALLAKLHINLDQIPGIVDAALALGTAALALWGYFVHSESNAVTIVDAMPHVAGIITTNTTAGRALSESIPSPTVQVATSPEATVIAKNAGPKGP